VLLRAAYAAGCSIATLKCRTGDNLLHLVALFDLGWLVGPLLDAGVDLCTCLHGLHPGPAPPPSPRTPCSSQAPPPAAPGSA
jgi:hypothetical protein